MIVFERYGHTFEIEDDDWKNLRKRFNPKNAYERKDSYQVDVPCSLCEKFDNYCVACPMNSFHFFTDKENQSSCGGFLSKLFPKIKFLPLRYSVAWSKRNNIPARRQLNRLQNFMDKIEKENQNETKKKLTHNE